MKLHVVVSTCKPNTREVEAGDQEFENSWFCWLSTSVINTIIKTNLVREEFISVYNL